MDELIAGIPLNSAQRLEIGKLKEQIATLQKENDELKREKAALSAANNESNLIRAGGAYFKKGADGEPMGYPYCLHCWEGKQKHSSVTKILGNIYACYSCKTQFQGGGSKRPVNDY